MALDRWVGLILLGICLVYGYTAWFTMDDGLAPFMRRNPIWPSTFPKALSILGIVFSLIIVTGAEKTQAKPTDIDYRRLMDYNIGQVVLLLALMVAYALLLRPAGFLFATTSFLFLGAYVLGERRYIVMIVVGAIATGGVWYLVQEVLGIFLRPLPWFVGV